MFGLLRAYRRKRLLANQSIPDDAWNGLVAETPPIRRLSHARQRRLRDLALLFLHEKRVEPAGGLVLTDAMRLRIAALACLPVLELGLDCYDGFVSVIVYPGEFIVRDREHVDDAGVVHTADDVLSGEAWERGPVVLGWTDVEASGRGDGYNVVVHEFAHKLDALDGVTNGVPPLHRTMRMSAWAAAFQSAYDRLHRQLDLNEDTWLDPYAAESPAEFFAVCAEMFFDVPDEFAAEHPDLYGQLAEYFRQDPARVT